MQRSAKLCSIVILGVYGAWGAFHPEFFRLLDGANLIFHESGHVVFGIFGRFIMMIGGTLMQLIVPAAVLVSFALKKQNYSASIMLFWFGENFIHISPYIKDARTQELPLVGGGVHDWHYILGTLKLLPYDQYIGSFVWLIGVAIMSVSIYVGSQCVGDE